MVTRKLKKKIDPQITVRMIHRFKREKMATVLHQYAIKRRITDYRYQKGESEWTENESQIRAKKEVTNRDRKRTAN